MFNADNRLHIKRILIRLLHFKGYYRLCLDTVYEAHAFPKQYSCGSPEFLLSWFINIIPQLQASGKRDSKVQTGKLAQFSQQERDVSILQGVFLDLKHFWAKFQYSIHVKLHRFCSFDSNMQRFKLTFIILQQHLKCVFFFVSSNGYFLISEIKGYYISNPI